MWAWAWVSASAWVGVGVGGVGVAHGPTTTPWTVKPSDQTTVYVPAAMAYVPFPATSLRITVDPDFTSAVEPAGALASVMWPHVGVAVCALATPAKTRSRLSARIGAANLRFMMSPVMLRFDFRPSGCALGASPLAVDRAGLRARVFGLVPSPSST